MEDPDAQGAEGTETEGSPPASDPKREQLETDNAKLREENRRLNAQALGKDHDLPGFAVDVLAGIPKDQQEAKAKELASELEKFKGQGTQPTTPQPSGESQPQAQPQQVETPVESPEAEKAKGMQTLGTPTEATPHAGGEADLNKAIEGASSVEELQRIQQERIASGRQAP